MVDISKTPYEDNFKELSELVAKSAEKQESFFRHIQLLSASILGILAALHQNADAALYIRLVYVALLLSLLLSILTSSIVVFDYAHAAERSRQAYLAELKKAINKNRSMKSVVNVGKLKRTSTCEKYSYTLWFASAVLLVSYSILLVF